MAKRRTKYFHFRSGQIHKEIRELDGKLHGPMRTWHFNGRLADELRYRHGLMHGISRQWNERGRLLASFVMNQGTGKQRYLYENGQVKMEIDSLAGRFHGRTRVWLRDGTLVKETFHIADRTVSRSEYLKISRDHPEWPRYQSERPGRVARQTLSLERRQHRLFIEEIFGGSHAEGRRWLRSARDSTHSLAGFRTQKSALRFVEKLYSSGAKVVNVAPIYGEIRKRLFADWVIIGLPKRRSSRNALRKICRDLCSRRGGALVPEKDIGEAQLFLRLA